MTSPQELSLLRAQAAAAEVVLHTFLPRLPARFDSIDALVCMGGYNTLTEAMSRSVPTVCVPRVVPRTEQLIRARAFAHLGFLRLLHPQDLSAESLRAQLRGALDTPRGRVAERVRAVLSFDGAEVAARELLALAALRPPAPRDLTDVSY